VVHIDYSRMNWTKYTEAVQKLELDAEEGMTTSDAQGCVEAGILQEIQNGADSEFYL
jgi:hypothetical protein